MLDKDVSKNGVSCRGPFGKLYQIYPFLFAYNLDYPEKVLACLVKYGRCCECLVGPEHMDRLYREDGWKDAFGKRKLNDFNLDSPDVKQRNEWEKKYGLQREPRIWYIDLPTARKGDVFGGKVS